MMTPREVAEHEFNTVRFNGYSIDEVNDFLDQVTADYTALYKENAILKNKMKILVDKIAEYRSTEEDMRLALLTARKTAAAIVEDAERQRDQILADMESEVAERRTTLRREMENSEAQLEAARQSTLDFASAMRALVAQQQAYLDREVEFLNRLNEIKAEDDPEETVTTASEPLDPAAVAFQNMLGSDANLAAMMAAAEAAAETDPDSAYDQDMSRMNNIVDEPTRIIDISKATDKDYKL